MLLSGVAVMLQAGIAHAQASFTDVTDYAGVGDRGYGVGTAWGDLNDDGYLDLYVVNLGQSNVLYLNSRDGTFQDITAAAGVGDTGDGVGCAWADYDNDGALDLFMTNRPGPARLFRNEGDSTFTDVAPGFGIADPAGWGESVAWGDYDNDGFVDLYKVRMQQSNILYRNLSGAGFSDVTAEAHVGNTGPGEGCAWCDYDLDDNLDLFVTNASGFNVLYRNNGDRTFTDCTQSAGLRVSGYSYGCAWGDYDNDGDFDLYVGRNGSSRLYQNRGDGTFADVSAAAHVDKTAFTLGVAWADYDNDGWLDLHLAIHQGDDVLYRNLRDGTFMDATSEAGVHDPRDARGNVWGDYDCDGFLDLYVANHQGQPNVLFKNGGNTNRFIQVRLRGAASNREAIGSRVTCVAGDLIMLRQVEGGSGFASQNSLPVEFGLAANVMADSLFVRWPSGTADTLVHIGADQILQFTEGSAAEVSFESVLGDAPDDLMLPPWPNPFDRATTFRYFVPAPSLVRVSVFDVRGRAVCTLVGSGQPSGFHELSWAPGDLAGGVYFCRLSCGRRISVRKVDFLPGR